MGQRITNFKTKRDGRGKGLAAAGVSSCVAVSGGSNRRRDMRLRLFDDGVERRRVADGQFAEHLAVQLDAGGHEGGDEAVVAQAALAQGGAEARDPEGSEVPLLLLALLVGVDVGLAGEFEGGPVI